MVPSRQPAGTGPIRRFVGGVLAAAVLTVTAAALPRPAAAIPEAAALAKLQVIPVFVLTNDKGMPLPIPRDKTLILPLYLDRARAESELAKLLKSNPAVKAQVLPLPMSLANERIAAMRKDLKPGYSLAAPVVPLQKDMEQAAALLRSQGVSDKQIKEGLSVPVFFTRPFLTLATPQGQRGVFFLSYDDLQNALARVPDKSSLKPQVADITAVLREIVRAQADNYIFYPTREYFRLVQQQSGGSPTPPPPPAVK